MNRFLRIFAIAAGLVACEADAVDSLTMSDFGYTNKLMVAGYTGTETLVNFPVLVRVSETRIPGFRFADMSAKNVNGKSMGYDLAFFAEDGTRLEIDKDVWNIDTTVEPTGEQLVWVKLPQMKQGTKFYMCYNVADGVYVTNDKPWGDYVGVWHLNETGGQNTVIADATTNGLNGVSVADNGEGVAAGKVGGARRIAKNNDHAHGIVVDVLSDSAKKAKAESLGTDFHASFWMMAGDNVNPSDYSGGGNLSYGNIIGRRKGDQGYSWGFQFGGDKSGQSTFDYMRVHSDNDNSHNKHTTRPIGAWLKLNDSRWKKVDLVWRYETNGEVPIIDIYTNGVYSGESTKPGVSVRQEDANIGIGCSTQPNPANASGKKGRRFNGSMDEVRLRPLLGSGAMPISQMADWVKADFDTVNNEDFVTIASPDTLGVEWAEDSGRIGVTNVALHGAVVGGIVSGFGSNTTACVIQGKFWKDGESEPAGWTNLVENLALFEAFEVAVPCQEGASYSYKLRAVDGVDGETEPVTGTFTTPTHLDVTWAETYRVGVTNVSVHIAVIGGTLVNMGSSASVTVEGKFWHGETEPEEWTTVGEPLSQTGDFSVSISGLAVDTLYSYKLRIAGSAGVASEPVSGTFTTKSELTVVWAASSALPGIERISHGYVVAGGTVADLGDSTLCRILYKLWIDGESEPAAWTPLSGNLAANDTCHENISVVDGTSYHYKLKAVGDNDEETAEVSGTFTSMSAVSGETHYFDDGTNAYWVANEFERYLPFTVTGYTGTETLTNFPVLVEVRKADTNGFSYDDFYHTGGRDIAFVDEKGHVIPHEIDTWNPNGMSLIWVRLPEMNNGTTFTMCYRSPLVNPPDDPGNVFEKYIGVWHMNEKANGVVDIIDSTTNNLIGETHALSLAYNNGRIGGARRVAQQSGTSSSFGRIIVFDNKNEILRTGVGNVFTYSCWSKLVDKAPGWAYLVSRKREDADKGWGVQYEDGNIETGLRAWSGSTEKGDYTPFGVSGYSHDKWAYWTFVYSNTTFHAYLNGVEQSSTVGGLTLRGKSTKIVHPVANDETADYANLVIGGQQVGTGALNGWVDECRYSKGIRSPDWIKAEYDSSLQQANWNDPAKRFVTKGDQVGRGSESLVPVVVWEQGADMPNTIIDVSYAYVQFAGTVTFCGAGADTCWIEYQMWADGEVPPSDSEWTPLLEDAVPGTVFAIPVCGLKQDMPYNFRIRAVNEVNGERRMTREHSGSFRTNGNVNEAAADGDLLRVDNRFVHRYPAGQYTFTTPDYVTNIEILVVGGGGAGGYKIGGGGGGGGVFHSSSYLVATSTTYRITVGRGGNAVTNDTTNSREGNGEYSFFALDSDPSHPLIEVPGGGGGGSCSKTANAVQGAGGASGGGGGGRGDTSSTGAEGGSAEEVNGVIYGHGGGNGNHFQKSGADGAYAAGGGGGGGRAGVDASSDKFYGGGSGGVGLGCNVLGEMLYFGAGGGGGYAYYEEVSGFSKPGLGGSGIGGDASDLKNGTLATSGVPNTGAGGGGGSMRKTGASSPEYWQGGHGGDGVVIVAYEVHGRDPIAEEPRISMTRCEYDVNSGVAAIDYRLYWAGVQSDLADIYVHYSTVGPEELTNSAAGGWVKVAESALGIGSVTFTPPEVGYTYWVNIVARKNAGSFYYSDETATFDVPAIVLNGATWTESKVSPTQDYATITYKLYDTKEDTHLYCYWSESREALETDEPPVGEGIFLLDLGPNTGTTLSSATTFTLPATEGLVRNKTYYIRLASGDAQGIKLFPSTEIDELDTKEAPITILSGASWADSNVATIEFNATVGKLDPEQTEVVALYSLVENDVKANNPETKASVEIVSLGLCADLALDAAQSTASFPLWSETITNYYVRLALMTNYVSEVEGVVTTNRVIVGGSYSHATQTISVSHAVEANTLLYIVTVNPKIMCYGDTPQALDFVLDYAGLMEGWGWENKYDLNGGSLACEVTSTSSSGNYPISQGTLDIVNGGQGIEHWDEGVQYSYQYKLAFSGATYTITNAVFSETINDITFQYTGDGHDLSALVHAPSGVRNSQPVSYRYRVGGSGDWIESPAFTNAGNYSVQFVASAPNHDDVRSTFKVTVAPAELLATIGDIDTTYTGEAQVPAVVTNVTGLVRGDINPLTCEFRDEAGEWQSEVPSFTLPGKYKLFFRVSAPNHTTFMTNCTFTIAPWDYMVNMDGMDGYNTPINVSDPNWLITHSVHTGEQLADAATRYADLNKVCGNGLRYWQNYVIGRTNLNQKLIATIMQTDKTGGDRVHANNFVVRFSSVQALRNTGLDVKFRLDKKLRGTRTKSEFAAASFDLGDLRKEYELNVPLAKEGEDYDPTGLYVFNVVLTPTNNVAYPGCSVLASITTVGVIRVSSPLTNTVTAVPWGSLMFGTETNAAVMVADVLNPNGLAGGDAIMAYDCKTRKFMGWTHLSGNDWDSLTSVTKSGLYESSANETRFKQGEAFWLQRTNPYGHYYLLGRYTGTDYVTELEGGTTNAPGHTLVANPTMFDVALNDLVFVDGKGNPACPAADDRIVFQDVSGMSTTYYRDAANEKWGRTAFKKVGRRIQQEWTEDGTNTVGTGFWYYRTASDTLKIKFESVK